MPKVYQKKKKDFFLFYSFILCKEFPPSVGIVKFYLLEKEHKNIPLFNETVLQPDHSPARKGPYTARDRGLGN